LHAVNPHALPATAERENWTTFTPPAAASGRRFRGLISHRRSQAMSTADRMVLMYRGRVEQAGPPAEVYARPRSQFAARFLGVANLLAGSMTLDGTEFMPKTGPMLRLRGQRQIRGDAIFALRGEEIGLTTGTVPENVNCLGGRIGIATFHGSTVEYHVMTDAGITLISRVPAPAVGGAPVLPCDTRVSLHWKPESGVVVAAENG
ncbi:TOBE domain-containing protein, partial [Paenirhodobacter populi]|uniref:TOBE domain-containing protein n=1 Tax=Paenirhodobacter populi TaxID=2306993 RepID=UPI0019D4388D